MKNPVVDQRNYPFSQNNFPLTSALLESGAQPSVGKDKQDEQVLHYQAKKEDKLDLMELYPDEKEEVLCFILYTNTITI